MKTQHVERSAANRFLNSVEDRKTLPMLLAAVYAPRFLMLREALCRQYVVDAQHLLTFRTGVLARIVGKGSFDAVG